MFKVAKARWKILTQILADAQAWFFAMLFYFTILVPFGLIMRLFSDPLALKGQPVWVEREPVSTQMDDARRQG